MANIGNFPIETNGEWQTLAEVTGLTFTADEKYLLQLSENSKCKFCEKSTTPEDYEGFTYKGDNERTIPYLVENNSPLYVRNLTGDCVITIAKKE